MPKLVITGYGDRTGYDRTATAIIDAVHMHGQRPRAKGALMGIAGASVQVRRSDGDRLTIERAAIT